MLIRTELEKDIEAISVVVTESLAIIPQSTGTEAKIVEALRAQNALDLSLVAVENDTVIGYLAASDARIGDRDGWSLIGPLGVTPPRRLQGIGSLLMEDALKRLRKTKRGVVLVGEPSYYSRFGFKAFPNMTVAGCPPEVVQALPFDGTEPVGEVYHHRAFALDQE